MGSFSPLKNKVFRSLWIATVISNIGHWMHEVGAAWLMTDLSDSPFMVALVQTSLTLPFFFFALPAGVLTDLLDRRKYLLTIQIGAAIAAAALAITGITIGYTPVTLLLFSFLLGLTTAMTAPAWQAVVPELVDKSELPNAVALNGMGVNIARAIGPAAAGLLVAMSGPTLVFALNALSFLYITWALWRWKRPAKKQNLPPEQFWAAVVTGFRFILHAPPFRAVLYRIGCFMISASAVWALLPVLARNELGLNATEYGILLGSLGAGAITLASQVTVLKKQLDPARMITIGGFVFAGVTLALALVQNFWVLLPVMFLGGASWLSLLSTFNVGAQAALPPWVRGRALSVYLLIFFGGMALGSLLWGAIADLIGTSNTLMAAAGLQLVAWFVTRKLPVRNGGQSEMTPSLHWPTPNFDGETVTERPLLLQKTYLVNSARVQEFVKKAERLRSIRLRDGANFWGIYASSENPGEVYEFFQHNSAIDHIRSHERFTKEDQDFEQELLEFHIGEEPPKVLHYTQMW
ncbi:MAG: MFS transporter [Verrucomicrobiota bacterium]